MKKVPPPNPPKKMYRLSRGEGTGGNNPTAALTTNDENIMGLILPSVMPRVKQEHGSASNLEPGVAPDTQDHPFPIISH